MPGRVTQLLVEAGSRVRRGAAADVIEAMKMEHTIAAPPTVSSRRCGYAVGDMVEEGAELIVLTRPGNPAEGGAEDGKA